MLVQGLDEATHALKLLEVASGRACAAWAGSCAFWAQTTVVIILMEMKQFSISYMSRVFKPFPLSLNIMKIFFPSVLHRGKKSKALQKGTLRVPLS